MNEDIRLQLTKIGNDAKKASNALSMASEDKKNQALMNMAELIENNQDEILKANNTDMKKAEEKGISDSFLDRLYLDKDRISSISNGLRSIVELNDPVGEEIGRWQMTINIGPYKKGEVPHVSPSIYDKDTLYPAYYQMCKYYYDKRKK